MTIHDYATTWRDLADQLTDEQVTRLERFEANALAEPAEVVSGLLEVAREEARMNLQDHIGFGHLSTPQGARSTDHWEDDGGGQWSRLFAGTERQVIEDVAVRICGEQCADGSITRGINVMYATACELTPAEARALAAALTDAADEIDAADS